MFNIQSVGTTATFDPYPRAVEGEEATVKGIPHSEKLLDYRRYESEKFVSLVLTLFCTDLLVASWEGLNLRIEDIKVEKVSGALTNTVFFISAPGVGSPPCKVLLRIYGPSTSDVIQRASEVFALYKLSSVYQIGPRIFGTFGNGRVEEYFDAL
ncbi:hypothetical protein FRC01_003200 [Tulasnella sp. 417]|nr:hypothetical protein FRC01_003200 [Tulasnella sp. 417]